MRPTLSPFIMVYDCNMLKRSYQMWGFEIKTEPGSSEGNTIGKASVSSLVSVKQDLIPFIELK